MIPFNWVLKKIFPCAAKKRDSLDQMVERGVGGWRGLPVGKGGKAGGGISGSELWGRHHSCGGRGCGESNCGVFIEGTARYLGEMSRRNWPDRPRTLATIQPCLGRQEAECYVRSQGTVWSWESPYKYQVCLGFELGPRRFQQDLRWPQPKQRRGSACTLGAP